MKKKIFFILIDLSRKNVKKLLSSNNHNCILLPITLTSEFIIKAMHL